MLLQDADQIIYTLLRHFRYDYKLVWSPDEYGGTVIMVLNVKTLFVCFLFPGVESLHVPSTHIWLPDIVLYNK